MNRRSRPSIGFRPGYAPVDSASLRGGSVGSAQRRWLAVTTILKVLVSYPDVSRAESGPSHRAAADGGAAAPPGLP
jgi:hypothetical protein